MRSRWKGYYVLNNYLSKPKFKDVEIKKMIYCRSSCVLKFMEKSYVLIHNGKMFRQIRLNRAMHSHKFGEFALTRKPHLLKGKNLKKIRFK